MQNGNGTVHVDEEPDLWAGFSVSSWCDAVSQPDSTFWELYKYTTQLIEEELAMNNHDVILEVGCGTGELLSSITTDVPRVGIDINPRFVEWCRNKYSNIDFDVVDATELVAWWKQSPYKHYKSPLILCCNNTMNIIPPSIRYTVTQEMRKLCSTSGRVMVSFWNGRYFSHGVMDFYLRNPALCGPVDVTTDINWKTNTLQTKSGYHTQWLNPEWVMRLLKCYDLDPQYSSSLIPGDCLLTHGLGIFVFFSSRTSGARDLYDSDDAQMFYSQVWGGGTMHLGRYEDVRLSSDPHVLSSQIINAQNLHEEDFCAAVKAKIEHSEGRPIPCRVLDMGCGYGGLLRKFKDYKFLRNGIGIDFSAKMCQQCILNNKLASMGDVIDVRNESFLDTSLYDETVDVCVSMEAFLHVGVERHAAALKEAHRVLRPGGWLLFSDILECPGVDRDEIKPMYEGLHLKKLGTVEEYVKLAKEIGFSEISFESHSPNVPIHYEALHALVVAYRNHPDPAKRLQASPEFLENQLAIMKAWANLSAGRIDWGIFYMRKV